MSTLNTIPPKALTIAGSDPSGGAGLQADLKTFQAFDVYGMSVVTLLTAQNTQGIKEVLVIGQEKVLYQLNVLVEDVNPDAMKLGALGHAGVVEVLAKRLPELKIPVVIDPVMMSKNQAPLLMKEALALFKQKLIPCATLLTPNLDEASLLSGKEVKTLEDMKEAARAIFDLGAENILVKGGHLDGSEAIDVLFDGHEFFEFNTPKMETRSTHGVGCTLSAAITAGVAKGKTLLNAIEGAKGYIQRAIETAPNVGSGFGPVNHNATHS